MLVLSNAKSFLSTLRLLASATIDFRMPRLGVCPFITTGPGEFSTRMILVGEACIS